MNTKPTEATSSVVASLQTSIPDFNFNDISENVKNAPKKSDRTEVTKELLEKLLASSENATIGKKENALSGLDYLTLYDYIPDASKKDLNEHINHLIELLNKDYDDKPGTLHVIANLTRASTKKDADLMFENFVNECDESDKFHDGVMELQEEVKNRGIVHNSLLEEAHYLFTKEEPKNPYEKDFNELNAYIASEKEKVWKALKVGSYYDNRVAITKKTKKYVTVEYGDKSRRFCKDDMIIFNRQGICSYFNLWDEESLDYRGDCLSTLFCTDKQDILEYLDKYDESVKDECLQLLWKSRPTYVSGDAFNISLKTFNKEYGYSTLKELGHISPFILFDDTDTVQKSVENKIKNEALKNVIYSTNWEKTNPNAYNDVLEYIPIVDMQNLTDSDLNAIERIYDDLKEESSLEKKFFREETTKAEAVLEFFQKKGSK